MPLLAYTGSDATALCCASIELSWLCLATRARNLSDIISPNFTLTRLSLKTYLRVYKQARCLRTTKRECVAGTEQLSMSVLVPASTAKRENLFTLVALRVMFLKGNARRDGWLCNMPFPKFFRNRARSSIAPSTFCLLRATRWIRKESCCGRLPPTQDS